MKRLLLLLLAATGNSPSPAPAPYPDATPGQRGAVNIDPTQRLRGKVFVDKVTVNADAGAAYVSTCAPTTDDLGTCPTNASALQCVTSTGGWYACALDGGWELLTTATSGVAGVTATAPLTSTGGTSPVIGCTPASGVAAGCATDGGQQFAGLKGFPGGIEVSFADAGRVRALNEIVADYFYSTNAQSGTVGSQLANFMCNQNPAASSPCLANFNDSMEIGGTYHGSPQNDSASIYLGAMVERDGGSLVDILQCYGAAGCNERPMFRFMYDGTFRSYGVFTDFNANGSSNGARLRSPNGGFYLQSTDGEILTWNMGSGNVASWYSGGGASYVGELNAAGRLWTRSMTTGSIDAGVILRDGVPVEYALTFNAPLSRTSNTVDCTPAASNTAGCIKGGTGVDTVSQILTPNFQFESFQFFKDLYYSSQFGPNPVALAAWNPGTNQASGIAANSLQSPIPGGAVEIMGRRLEPDSVTGVSVGAENWRDGGGYLFSVKQPRPCDSAVFQIDQQGNVHMGNAAGDRSCSAAVTDMSTIFDDTTQSGHTALARASGYYLAIAGALGGNETSVLADGGNPANEGYCDGGVNLYTHPLWDGGCVFSYAGGHGDVAIDSRLPMYAGFIAEFYNPLSPGGGARSDHRAYINHNGAYVQNHQISRANFPTPKQMDVLTQYGTYEFGSLPGTIMWDGPGGVAVGRGTQRWYWAEPLADAGAQWTKFEHQAPIYFQPPMFLNGAELDGTTAQLGCFIVPTSEQAQLNWLNVNIATAGAGGSTDAIVRAIPTGTGYSCDFTFACNKAAGTWRIESDHANGCSLGWGQEVCLFTQSKGDCTTGPIVLGSMSPEGLWE